MDRKQFNQIVDYTKLIGGDSVINEVWYQLFRDNNDPFIDIQTVEEKIAREDLPAEEIVEAGDKQIIMITDAKHDICFGRLLGEMSKKRSENHQINRMWYRINVVDHRITDKMVTRWIHLSKKHKFVPDSFEMIHVKREVSSTIKNYVLVVVNNVQDIPPPVFYLGASFLRCLREKPGAVVAGLHLMEEIGLNPYVAFVFLHRYCIQSLGHMPMNIEASYGQQVNQDTIDGITVPLGYILGLRRFIHSYEHSTKMTKETSFQCSDTISSLRPKELHGAYGNIYDTMEPKFTKILECAPGSKAENESMKDYVKVKGTSNVE